MDPEPSTQNGHDEDDVAMITGNAIFTYQKPIFTAVIIPREDPVAYKASEDASALSHLIPANLDGDESVEHEEEQQQQVSVDDNKAEKRDAELLSSLYKYSLVFGWLVGCFIQSSSLGANYILLIVFGRDFQAMAKHHSHIMAFSLMWFFLTSLMGIVILLILRSLVSLASYGLNQKNLSSGRKAIFLNREQSLVAYLEFPFAFGALAGVCASWAVTDLVLGMQSHAYHSILALCAGLVGKVVFEAISSKDSSQVREEDEQEANEEDWSVKKPLLAEADDRESAQEKVRKIHNEFKFKGLSTGLLVGFFIQFSSLGASFLIDAHLIGSTSAAPLSKQTLLFFSLGWSFVFGTMGVTILLLLRYLVGIVCEHILSQSQGSESEVEEEEDMADRWSISLEFFFAVGCLVGVNVAWLITDVGLGLNAHVCRSLLTLGAAMAWCYLLAHCCGFNKVINGRNAITKIAVTRATQTPNGLLIV